MCYHNRPSLKVRSHLFYRLTLRHRKATKRCLWNLLFSRLSDPLQLLLIGEVLQASHHLYHAILDSNRLMSFLHSGPQNWRFPGTAGNWEMPKYNNKKLILLIKPTRDFPFNFNFLFSYCKEGSLDDWLWCRC